jgi:hypothetical protein
MFNLGTLRVFGEIQSEKKFNEFGMSCYVCVSNSFREQDVKNYRKCLAVICYVYPVEKTLL